MSKNSTYVPITFAHDNTKNQYKLYTIKNKIKIYIKDMWNNTIYKRVKKSYIHKYGSIQ